MSDVAASVRRGGADDAPSLRAIRLEALADTPEAYGTTYEEVATWPDARWRGAASEWVFFLGEHEGVVRGLARGGHHDLHPGTHWLYAMYVAPAARGGGLARMLVDAVAQWASGEGARAIHLHVGSQVPRARAFYEKIGFRPTGEVGTMGRGGSMRLVTMVKDLD
ncbi:MAG TPA: GNAT family N-acetyltransferase [Acidimicrobiales bacterium]|nr:GNAT family N-acetyltransferase [Acidimicrobiales bacterium]